MEENPFLKKWRKGVRSVALVYPNRYVGGISNLGLQYIYAYVNSRDDAVCERFYTDIHGGIRSLESGRHLKEFDVALFSLQYEEDYLRAVRILKESGFRGLKIAGGPCCMINPKPVLRYFDAFVIGEVEGSEVIDEIIYAKDSSDLSGVDGIYTGMEDRVRRIYPKKLDFHLRRQIIGEGAYGRCLLLEVGRGCVRRCRFCVVRTIYHPPRWRDVRMLLEIAEEYRGVVDKVALIGPSVSDHPRVKDLISGLVEMGFRVSPSSIRADTVDEELMELLSRGGLRSFTIAPEAGSERLREVLRKDIEEEDVIRAAQLARDYGFKGVKMYFMIGIPGESEKDVEEIVRLVERVREIIPKVSVSVNPLVPKPHTPMQWAPYTGFRDVRKGIRELKRRARYLKSKLSSIADVSVERVEDFAVQTILSRGDTDVCKMIDEGRLTIKAAEKIGLFRYLEEIPLESNLPWDFIDHGYSKDRLAREHESMVEGR